MRNIKFYFLYVLTFFSVLYSAQTTIDIAVNDQKGNPLTSARILFSEKDSNDYKEFAIVRNGTTSYALRNQYDNLVVTAEAHGYHSQSKKIAENGEQRTLSLSFNLIKNTEHQIEEVVVSRRIPIVQKKDTVVYNIENFKDGTEVKLEDVLKKLPGVQVNESTGTITYLGKEIETLTLDGDDLFDKNYTVGSKNIDIDIVDQVEAVSNFSRNRLLRSVSDSENVSLNIKLKKNVANFSGSVNYLSGFYNDGKQAVSAGTTLLALYRRYKAFTSISYNNVGTALVPYNADHQLFKQANFLNRELSGTGLPAIRSNMNDDLQISTNHLVSVNDKTSVKANFNFQRSDLHHYKSMLTEYSLPGNIIKTVSKYEINDRPSFRGLRLELNSDINDNNRFNNVLYWLADNNRFRGDYTVNDVRESRNLKQYSNLVQNNSNYTYKINNESAIDVHTSIAKSKLTENQHFLSFDISNTDIGSEKTTLDINAQYLLKKKNISFVQTAEYAGNSTFFNQNNSVRERNYSGNRANATSRIRYGLGKWNFEARLSPVLLTQKYESSKNHLESEDFFLEPFLSTRYVLSSKSNISLLAWSSKKALLQDFLFDEDLRVSQRDFVRNEISLDLSHQQSIQSRFLYNDFDKNFSLNSFVTYNRTKGNFVPFLQIEELRNYVSFYYNSSESQNLIYFVNASKLIYPIRSTLEITSNYIRSNHFNSLDGTSLRKNTVENLYFKFGVKTGFRFFLNFSNHIEFSKIDINSRTEFRNETLKNSFSITARVKRGFNLVTTYQYMVPALNQSFQNYHFLDFSAYYMAGNKFHLLAHFKNMLNQNAFVNVLNMDYFKSVQSTQILPFHFYIGVGFRF